MYIYICMYIYLYIIDRYKNNSNRYCYLQVANSY